MAILQARFFHHADVERLKPPSAWISFERRVYEHNTAQPVLHIQACPDLPRVNPFRGKVSCIYSATPASGVTRRLWCILNLIQITKIPH
jgi:hypothetical protein